MLKTAHRGIFTACHHLRRYRRLRATKWVISAYSAKWLFIKCLTRTLWEQNVNWVHKVIILLSYNNRYKSVSSNMRINFVMQFTYQFALYVDIFWVLVTILVSHLDKIVLMYDFKLSCTWGKYCLAGYLPRINLLLSSQYYVQRATTKIGHSLLNLLK